MTISNLSRNVARLLFFAAFLNACSSAPRSEISASANINEEVQSLDSQIADGVKNHYDILAKSDFQKSIDRLKKAKKQMENDYDREDILETLSEASGYYDRAAQTAEEQGQHVPDILKTREAAILAGARKSTEEKKVLNNIDEDFRNEVEDDDIIDTDDFNSLLSRYLELEKASVKTTEIGEVRSKIQAVTKKAKDQAPRTLDKARKDLASANNAISANVRNPNA